MGSTVITLILVPVLYSMMDEAKQRRLQRKIAKAKEIEMLEEKWRKELLNREQG